MTVYEALTEYRFMETLPELIRNLVNGLDADPRMKPFPEVKKLHRDHLRRQLFRAGIACQEAQKAVKEQPSPRREILTLVYLHGSDNADVAE